MNRPPRKKVTVIIERGEEGDSQAAVCHGIQQTMAGGRRKKEIHPHGESAKSGQDPPKSHEHHSARRDSSKKKRVGESAMAPEVTVTDAEPESDHIEVGNHGTNRADHANSFGRAGAVKTGSYAQG